MNYFRSARGFLGRMAGPAIGQRLSQVNQNKINNFARKLTNNNAKQAFDSLPNNKTRLALINVFKGSSNPVSKSDIIAYIQHQSVLKGQTNYGQAGRKAAAIAGYAAQRGALGAGVLAAAPIGLTGYAGYQGGRAAARGAQIFADAASKKYGNVKNTVSAKYGQLSGRNTNKRVANLSANVNKRVSNLNNRVAILEARVKIHDQMMAKAGILNNYKTSTPRKQPVESSGTVPGNIGSGSSGRIHPNPNRKSRDTVRSREPDRPGPDVPV